MIRHTYDPRTNLHQSAMHDDPKLRDALSHLIVSARPDCWIETGTHMGWGAIWVAENSRCEVHTVELDDDFYKRSGENITATTYNIYRYKDDSRSFLWSILSRLRNLLPIFWLDAHWNPPPPLKEECLAVSKLDRFVCLIDDFRCYAPTFGGDAFYSRPSLDYTKTDESGGGQAYGNDLSYTASELLQPGVRHYRPCYTPGPGHQGVGMFVKGVDYVPPPELFREETWEQFLATRPADALPLHPSSEFRAPTYDPHGIPMRAWSCAPLAGLDP